MRLDLLDRWLLKELLGPLLFFIALFTLLLLTGGVMFELVRQMVDKNLPITIAVQVLLFSIPRWLAFSVPIGTLMASLFVFTRLSANSELTALRSLGITTVRMISAALALSLVMTLFTFVPVSYTHLRAHETSQDLVCRLLRRRNRSVSRNGDK